MGYPWPAGKPEKSYAIIEINIDTHNDLSVISYEFWCDGGWRVTLEPITIHLSSLVSFGGAAGDP